MHPRNEGMEFQATLFPTSTPCCNIAGSLAATEQTRDASGISARIYDKKAIYADMSETRKGNNLLLLVQAFGDTSRPNADMIQTRLGK